MHIEGFQEIVSKELDDLRRKVVKHCAILRSVAASCLEKLDPKSQDDHCLVTKCCLRMLETGSQSKDDKIRVKHLKTIEKPGNLFLVSRDV